MSDDPSVQTPRIVAWDEKPPADVVTQKSMWDEVFRVVRAGGEGEWAKVVRPSNWNSSSLKNLRRNNPDLDIVMPSTGRGPGVKANEHIWIRRKPETSDE